jgi:hypothetical protein
MSEDESKQIRDEVKRPEASLWTRNENESGRNEVIAHTSPIILITLEQTPVASRRRVDVQVRTGVTEKTIGRSEGEGVENEDHLKGEDTYRKNERRGEEEKYEAQRVTAVLPAERQEGKRRRSREVRMMMEVSDEEDIVVLPPREEPRRSKSGWMRAWTATFDCHPSSLSLFAMSTLLPPCRGVTVEGHPRNREILIVGDIGEDNLYCVAGHLLLLTQSGRRSPTTFNTNEEYRGRKDTDCGHRWIHCREGS